MNRSFQFATLSSLFLLLACSGAVDIGGERINQEEGGDGDDNGNDDGDGDGGTGNVEREVYEDCLEVEKENLAEPTESPFTDPMQNDSQVGSWLGYVQHAGDLQLELKENGEGTIVFGDPDAAPSSDPREFAKVNGPALEYEVIQGFHYTVYNLAPTETRVRFAIDAHEPFREFCSEQTPHLVEESCHFRCLEPPPGYPGECDVEGDCVAWASCFLACDCTSAGCGTRPLVVEFDGEVSDGQIRGTFDNVMQIDGLDDEVILDKK